MEAAHDDNGGEEIEKPQLSSRVAHGKVCRGAGPLSVRFKGTAGSGTVLC